MTEDKSFVFRFKDIEVHEQEFRLIKAGESFSVEPTPFRVLLYMVTNPQRLIAKEELLNAVWGDAAVTENSLARSIAQLRRILGDDVGKPRYIETVARLGYRFLCSVQFFEDPQRKPEVTNEKNGPEGSDPVQGPAKSGLEGAALDRQVQTELDRHFLQSMEKGSSQGTGIASRCGPGNTCIPGDDHQADAW